MAKLIESISFFWVIDGEIPLTQICIDAEWHRASTIQGLKNAGLKESDSESFTAFAFAEVAEISDCDPIDCLNDSQWDRLTIEKSH